MKRTFLLLWMLSLYVYSFSQSVGIGTALPNNTAVLDVQSTTKGLLPPRMSTSSCETNWAIQRTVTSDPGHPGDALGRAVGADGHNVIIGIPRYSLGNRLQPKVMLLNLEQ